MLSQHYPSIRTNVLYTHPHESSRYRANVLRYYRIAHLLEQMFYEQDSSAKEQMFYCEDYRNSSCENCHNTPKLEQIFYRENYHMGKCGG